MKTTTPVIENAPEPIALPTDVDAVIWNTLTYTPVAFLMLMLMKYGF